LNCFYENLILTWVEVGKSVDQTLHNVRNFISAKRTGRLVYFYTFWEALKTNNEEISTNHQYGYYNYEPKYAKTLLIENYTSPK
jgi:hypothetical protein